MCVYEVVGILNQRNEFFGEMLFCAGIDEDGFALPVLCQGDHVQNSIA
jgi:hypothetical protein